MGKRTKLKSNYRKRSKRTRKYSFKRRKNTRKRRKQKGGADTPQQQLLEASREGNTKIVRELLEQGAKINTVGKNSNTPLHLASYFGHKDIVTELLSKKEVIEIDKQNIDKYTSLHFASMEGHTEIVKLLLENKAEINQIDKIGDTPLHLASLNGHTDTVNLLIDEATIDSQNIDGDTPLHLASEKGHTKTVQELLNRGADIKLQNIEGNNPLHIACGTGKSQILQLLINKDTTEEATIEATIDATIVEAMGEPNKQNLIPLHIACFFNQEESLKVCLEFISQQNVDEIKIMYLNHPIYNLNLEKNPSLEHKYQDAIKEYTRFKRINPLGLAIWQGHYNIAELLINSGIRINLVIELVTGDTFNNVEEFVTYVWKEDSDIKKQLLELRNLG